MSLVMSEYNGSLTFVVNQLKSVCVGSRCRYPLTPHVVLR